MTKHWRTVAGTLCVTCLLASCALAADAAAAPQASPPPAPAQPEVRVAAMLAKLNLTDDQKAKVKEIMEAARTQAQQAAEPAEKLKAVKDAVEKIRTSVLTDDQRKQLEGAREKVETGLEGLGGLFLDKLKLTDDQKAKVKELVAASRAELEKAAGAEAKAKIIKDAIEKIRTGILTDDQRKALEDLRAQAVTAAETRIQDALGGLKLTDDQKAKVKEIFTAARAKAAEAAGPEAKVQVLREAFQKIRAEVLTDEQRKQLESAQDKVGTARERLQERLKERRAENGNAQGQ
jgi:Spy/CpxP family protein refolding chaperone